jgi:hypothetical protein
MRSCFSAIEFDGDDKEEEGGGSDEVEEDGNNDSEEVERMKARAR